MKSKDIRPASAHYGRLLEAMQARDFQGGWVGALSELIDNSFDAGATEVDIDWVNGLNRVLTITDDGVGVGDLTRLFSLGRGERAPGEKTGVWGVGGKAAQLWASSEVEIWSLHDDMVAHDRIVWEEHFGDETPLMIDTTFRPSTTRNTPEKLRANGHGVCIRMKVLTGRRFHADRLVKHLAEQYPRLSEERKRIVFQGAELRLGWKVQAGFETFDVVIPYKDTELTARVVAGLVPDELRDKQPSKVMVCYGPRRICLTRDCYGSYSGDGVSGILLLGGGWHAAQLLSEMKTSIVDDDVWEQLMHAVYEHLEPILKQAKGRSINLKFREMSEALTAAFQKPVQTPVRYQDHETGWIAVREQRKQEERKKRQAQKRPGQRVPPRKRWPEPDGGPVRSLRGTVGWTINPVAPVKVMFGVGKTETLKPDRVVFEMNETLVDRPDAMTLVVSQVAARLAGERRPENTLKFWLGPTAATELTAEFDMVDAETRASILARALVERVQNARGGEER
jgi:Histidine kinase-, DNA gyrase B-, and HSP90-like ATPase